MGITSRLTEPLKVSHLENYLLQQSPNAVMAIDSDGYFVYQNTTFQYLYDFSTKETNIADIFPEIDLQLIKNIIIEGGSYDLFVDKLGRSYRVTIRGLRELSLAAIYSTDITDLMRVEEDLLRSQNILRRVLDTDPNLIFVKDRYGRFILCNKAVGEVYGTSVDNLIGKRDADFNPKPEEIDHFLSDDLEVIENKQEKHILEESVTDARGNSRFFSTVKRPLQLSQNEDTYVLGVSNDISAIKKLQAQLAQASKMEALGQLAGGIAHDFNNLLTAILGHADILGVTHGGSEQILKSVSMIQVAANRAKSLTEQLLGFARQGKHQNTTVNMYKLVLDTLALLKRTIDPSVVIEIEQLAESVYVKGDPTQLQQVVMNLILNAKDAVLTSTTGNAPRIDIKFKNISADSRILEIAFGDNGCGIKESDKERVFEPFFTTKAMGKGTGLGLSTTYGIVKNHDGEIRVESGEGQGTFFYVRLPVCPSNLNIDSASSKLMPAKAAGTLLLIDDHADVLAVASSMLETLGYRVLSYMSGAEAVRAYANSKQEIDAAIIDVMMPSVSGVETASLLKKIRPELPILLMSGCVQADEMQKILDKGYKFLKKPFELTALSEMLNEIIVEPLCKM